MALRMRSFVMTNQRCYSCCGGSGFWLWSNLLFRLRCSSSSSEKVRSAEMPWHSRSQPAWNMNRIHTDTHVQRTSFVALTTSWLCLCASLTNEISKLFIWKFPLTVNPTHERHITILHSFVWLLSKQMHLKNEGCLAPDLRDLGVSGPKSKICGTFVWASWHIGSVNLCWPWSTQHLKTLWRLSGTEIRHSTQAWSYDCLYTDRHTNTPACPLTLLQAHSKHLTDCVRSNAILIRR